MSEDATPRGPGPNNYFLVEDYLRKQEIRYCCVLPSYILGHAPAAMYDLATSLAVYAVLCRECEVEFQYPGNMESAQCLYDVTSAKQLAECLVWSSENFFIANGEEDMNSLLNVSGGDFFTWHDMWPRLADFYEVIPSFSQDGFCLGEFFLNHRDAWSTLATKHNLKESNLLDLIDISFVDKALYVSWSCIYSSEKAKSLGFTYYPGALEALKDVFQDLKEQRIIP